MVKVMPILSDCLKNPKLTTFLLQIPEKMCIKGGENEMLKISK